MGGSVCIVSYSEPLCGPLFQALISTHGGCPAEHGGAPVRGDVSVNVPVQGKCEDWCPRVITPLSPPVSATAPL